MKKKIQIKEMKQKKKIGNLKMRTENTESGKCGDTIQIK